MSPADPVVLTRSCFSCIKAKRKCDRALPHCRRCELLGLHCRYRNTPSAGYESGGTVSTESIRALHQTRERRTGLLNSSDPDSNKMSVILNCFAVSYLTSMRLDEPYVLMEWDDHTLRYLIETTGTIPGMFARTRSAPFIHPGLYSVRGLPAVLQIVSALCGAHLADSAERCTLSSQISRAGELLTTAADRVYDFQSTLELVQALVLFHIVRLASGHVTNPDTDHYLTLLFAWTQKLYHSVPATLPASLPPYDAWILGESVRRTMHYAHKCGGLSSMLRRGYYCLTAFCTALPVNTSSRLWDLAAENVGPDAGPLVQTTLISYRELTDGWERAEVRAPGSFERMLLIACKGVDEVCASLEN